jgi:[ribosomal protein S5]-alanine N-acetyltransferase
MLRGNTIQLRPVRETDLDMLYDRLADISNRGDYFPVRIPAEPALRRQFHDGKLWSDDAGLLLIVDAAAAVIGHIEFFKPVAYLDGYELSYLIYDLAARGRGATSEAVCLLVRYLFETRKINRLQLVIHPDNAASRRIAEKNGFAHESTMRGAWYHRGRYHDVEVYALLRPAP